MGWPMIVAVSVSGWLQVKASNSSWPDFKPAHPDQLWAIGEGEPLVTRPAKTASDTEFQPPGPPPVSSREAGTAPGTIIRGGDAAEGQPGLAYGQASGTFKPVDHGHMPYGPGTGGDINPATDPTYLAAQAVWQRGELHKAQALLVELFEGQSNGEGRG